VREQLRGSALQIEAKPHHQVNQMALAVKAAGHQNTLCSPANCSISPHKMSVFPANKASQPVFRAFFWCLKKAESILS